MQVLHEVAACKNYIQNNGKLKNCQAKKWSLSLMRGGHLQVSVEVPNCRALTGKVMVVWMGGRIWRFNCS